MTGASVQHWAAVALIIVAALSLAFITRRFPGDWTHLATSSLAGLLAVAEVSWWGFYLPTHGGWAVSYGLPLQLCDATAFIAAAALWWRQQLLIELTYFWGIGGSGLALLTPDLHQSFPSFPYLQFYIAHGTVIVAAALLVVGLRRWPRAGRVWKTFLLTLGFAVVAGVADLLTGGNYLYLRQKPAATTLLTFMGPWPDYIVGGVALAVIFLYALDLPFRWIRR